MALKLLYSLSEIWKEFTGLMKSLRNGIESIDKNFFFQFCRLKFKVVGIKDKKVNETEIFPVISMILKLQKVYWSDQFFLNT